MPAETAAEREQVNVFTINNTVLFKHYFDGNEVFYRLKPYYNSNEYRFEVPVGKFDSLRRFLRTHGYDMTIIDRQTDYYVAVKQYSAHPDGIFKLSVYTERVDGYNCFLMKDQDAVKTAINQGAERLSALPLRLSTETLADFATPSV